MNVEIREIQVENLPRVTEIHLHAFQDRALSSLGKEAVRRYYEWLLTGPHDAIALGAFEGQNLIGYCFAGLFRGALSGFLRKNRWYLILQVLSRPWLLGNSLIRDRIKTAFKWLYTRAGRGKSSSPMRGDAPREKSFGVLAIAVDPFTQRKGVGQRLMEETEKIAQQRGFKKLNLSVATDNLKAISFYEKLGWRKVIEKDQWQGRMIKELP